MKIKKQMPYHLTEYDGGLWFEVFDENKDLVARFSRMDDAEKFVNAHNSSEANEKRIEAILDVVRQYQAAVELNAHIHTSWSVYREGKEVLSK